MNPIYERAVLQELTYHKKFFPGFGYRAREYGAMDPRELSLPDKPFLNKLRAELRAQDPENFDDNLANYKHSLWAKMLKNRPLEVQDKAELAWRAFRTLQSALVACEFDGYVSPFELAWWDLHSLIQEEAYKGMEWPIDYFRSYVAKTINDTHRLMSGMLSASKSSSAAKVMRIPNSAATSDWAAPPTPPPD
jgi:hypothetical protein